MTLKKPASAGFFLFRSNMEKRAAEAERASIKYKQVEFLMTRIGETFYGIVNGVIPNPPFVEILNHIPTDGYIASGGGTDIAGYQWSTLSGGPIEGETNQVLEDPLDGLYHVVTVTNSYGCGTDSEATIFYASGVSDHDESDWLVWFDAASRTIASNRPFDRVEWFDASGRLVKDDAMNSSELRIARVWRNQAYQVVRITSTF
jgi:hypothetical protein